jgi:hypothetical protein
VLGRHHAAITWREIQGRKLKSVMARKANSKSDQEMEVARYLASAFIAYSHGTGMDYARKKYAHMPVGPFWLEVARMVIAGTSGAGENAAFVVPADSKIQ